MAGRGDVDRGFVVAPLDRSRAVDLEQFRVQGPTIQLKNQLGYFRSDGQHNRGPRAAAGNIAREPTACVSVAIINRRRSATKRLFCPRVFSPPAGAIPILTTARASLARASNRRAKSTACAAEPSRPAPALTSRRRRCRTARACPPRCRTRPYEEHRKKRPGQEAETEAEPIERLTVHAGIVRGRKQHAGRHHRDRYPGRTAKGQQRRQAQRQGYQDQAEQDLFVDSRRRKNRPAGRRCPKRLDPRPNCPKPQHFGPRVQRAL